MNYGICLTGLENKRTYGIQLDAVVCLETKRLVFMPCAELIAKRVE